MGAPVHALVLAAGLRTRLRPLTFVRAKPALPIGGEPLVRRIIRWLAANGIREIVVNLHHLPATVTAVLGDGSDLAVRIRYSWEQPLVLGTAGGPRRALDIIGVERFFIVNGDTLTDLDLAALALAHEEAGALATLALTSNPEPHRYGSVLVDNRSSVAAFVPRGVVAERPLHFIGVQIVEAAAFRDLAAGQPMDSIGGAYDALMRRQPGSLRGFMCEAAFWDIGTPQDYVSTSRRFGDHDAEGRSVRIDPTAHITRSILWDDIEVGAGVCLDDCIITDGVRIGAGARYERAILRRAPDGGILVNSWGE